MLTPDQIEELCPAVFGIHRWEWNEQPVLMTFHEASGTHVCNTYERTCRTCGKHEAFDAPSQRRGSSHE
jgi:hypothetical protein